MTLKGGFFYGNNTLNDFINRITVLFFCANETIISFSLQHKMKGKKREIGAHEYITRTEVTSIKSPLTKLVLRHVCILFSRQKNTNVTNL